MEDFESLPLHDATINEISISWQNSRIAISLSAFVDQKPATTQHKLVFLGVKEFFCPHLSPWGESSLINSVSISGGMYEIEMQSGDVLEFKADRFEFE